MEDLRLLFAVALSEELSIDMTPEFLRSVDMLLMRMWLSGVRLSWVD